MAKRNRNKREKNTPKGFLGRMLGTDLDEKEDPNDRSSVSFYDDIDTVEVKKYLFRIKISEVMVSANTRILQLCS